MIQNQVLKILLIREHAEITMKQHIFISFFYIKVIVTEHVIIVLNLLRSPKVTTF